MAKKTASDPIAELQRQIAELKQEKQSLQADAQKARRSASRAEAKAEDLRLKSAVRDVLQGCTGRVKAMPMSKLQKIVCGEGVGSNSVNRTRRIRELVEELRSEGYPILSSKSRTDGGYYLAQADSELHEYLRAEQHRGVKIFANIARIKKTSLSIEIARIQKDLDFQGQN